MSEARKVFLALPVHDKTVCASLLVCLISDLSQCMAQGIQFFACAHEGDSNPAHARNVILGNFMASDCTDLVSIDHDISWQPGALLRLLSHPVDFVGGTYRFKREEEGYPVGWLLGPNDPRTADGLVEVARLPGGFMRMTRAGLERVVAQCEDGVFESHILPGVKLWYLYHERLVNRQLVTEDYTFCDNVRMAGEKVWLDPELKLDHTGKTVFRGNLDAFIAENNRQQLPDEERAELDAKLIKFAQSLATPEMDRVLREAIGKAA